MKQIKLLTSNDLKSLKNLALTLNSQARILKYGVENLIIATITVKATIVETE